MKIICGNLHKINYKDICCFINLIEMSDIAENQMKVEKFSSTIYITINKIYEDDNVQFEKFSLFLLKKFLEVLSKYVNFFYFSGKLFNYSLRTNRFHLDNC